MKKFIFTLQKLLDINISIEKQQKNELTVINKRINMLESDKLQKESEIEQMHIQTEKLLSEHCKVEKIQSLNFYIFCLNKKVNAIKGLLEEENIKRQKVQAELTNTMIKRKSLEKLREKQYKQYLSELKKEEEKASDDFVTFSYLYG